MSPLVIVVVLVASHAGAFVFGVLFGRKNVKLVEQTVASAKADLATLQLKVAALEAQIKAKV